MSARKNLIVRCKQSQQSECGAAYLDQRLPACDPQPWVGRKKRVDVSNCRKERRTCSSLVVIRHAAIALNGCGRALNVQIDPRRELNEWAEDYNPMRPLARNVEQKGRE
jgi:hypothetical protein